MTQNTNNINWRHRYKWHWPIDGLMLSPSLIMLASDWPSSPSPGLWLAAGDPVSPRAGCWSGMPGLVLTLTPAPAAHSSQETRPGPRTRGGGGQQFCKLKQHGLKQHLASLFSLNLFNGLRSMIAPCGQFPPPPVSGPQTGLNCSGPVPGLVSGHWDHLRSGWGLRVQSVLSKYHTQQRNDEMQQLNFEYYSETQAT